MKRVIFWMLIFLMIGCSGLIGYVLKKCNCDADDSNLLDEDVSLLEKKYTELNSKLFDYLEDIYNDDEWMNGNVESGVYIVNLSDLKNKGYDISMFVNPITNKQCDLEKTYGRFIVLGIKEDGKTDYVFNTNVDCEGTEEIEN